MQMIKAASAFWYGNFMPKRDPKLVEPLPVDRTHPGNRIDRAATYFWMS